MAGKRSRIPKYGTVEIKGHIYYRTAITDSEGKQCTLYAKTREELYDKELDTLSQVDDDRQRRKSPTVADYCEKWLVMDIYAKVKYNRPDDVVKAMTGAFAEWDAS